MTDRCDSIDAYVDDEMSDEDRAEFESHLASCERCGAELPRLLALMAAVDRAGEAASTPSRQPRLALVTDEPQSGEPPDESSGSAAPAGRLDTGRAGRRGVWIAGASAVALAAGLLAVLQFRPPTTGPTAPVIASLEGQLGPTRPFPVRLSYPGTEAHRQVDVQRGGAGQPSAQRLQLELELQRASNWHGAAVLALLAGRRSDAAAAFAKASITPQLQSDRAAFEIVEGSLAALERALEAADRALEGAPGLAAARWNRALALAGLNLPLAAALDFDRVAALGEAGWAAEAKERADALRAQVVARRVHWKRASDAGRALIADGTPVPAELTDVVGYMTIRLYDAVRSAPSRSAVEALLPLATTIDTAYRSDHATAYVRRIAASDFRVRKPLADGYRDLVLGTMPAASVDAFLKRLDQPGVEDLWLGAMVRTKRAGSQLERYRQRAAATRDPWLIAIAEQETAKAEIAGEQRAMAEARLRDAIAFARRAHLEYRKILLQAELVELYRQTQNLAQAHRDAQEVYRDATGLGEGVVEMNGLTALAAINQDRYALGLARAYLTELVERTDTSRAGPSPLIEDVNCAARQYAYEALANVAMQLHDPERARAELSLAPSCPSGPTLLGTLVRSDLYRLYRQDQDLQIARDHLAVLRARPSTPLPAQALLSYIEGALLIDVDRSAGQQALRDAIARAGNHRDPYNYSVKARAYSFSQLALDAGRASEFPRVLEILAETLEVRKPERCAVAIATQDERTAVAFADARGEVDGRYTVSTTAAAPDVARLVPSDVVERLRACDRVVVLTRAPVLGAARLLPPQIAWSYLLKGTSPAPVASGRRLVIANPEAPPDLNLPALRPYPASDGNAVVLRGLDATPTRVALAMRDASMIEFHTHGFIGNDVSEASYLVLSPELGRQYAMTAGDVARVKLDAAPLVILGACHAATSSLSKEGGMGLAEAFLRSGARAVVASPDAVQDLGAHEFFAGVRDRVMRGIDPVVALRDERLHRLAKSQDDAWVSGVVVFE